MTTPTPADELQAAAVRAREIGDPLHLALAPLLEAVSCDPDDESLNDPGSDRHDGCDRTVCAPAAALAVARQILGTTEQPEPGCERCRHRQAAHNVSGCIECPGGWRADHRFVCASTEQPDAAQPEPTLSGAQFIGGLLHTINSPTSDTTEADDTSCTHPAYEVTYAHSTPAGWVKGRTCVDCRTTLTPLTEEPYTDPRHTGPVRVQLGCNGPEAAQPEPVVDIIEALKHDSVRCPLCPNTLILRTPSGARAHFTVVHPEQQISGRHGPWPVLVTQPDTAVDRRARYAAAIRETDGWVLDDGQHMIDAVMAVADSEVAASLRATTGEQPEQPLSPYYSHEACGFCWHGRDGMDIPMRDGQPICPRCELAAVVQPEPEPHACPSPENVQVWPLQRVLTEVRCGSQDWTWEEEWADLDQRHAESGYLDRLEQQIRTAGITMPVLIGTDGRLWDGHHRLRIAVRLGIGYVPVEVVQPDAAQPEATRSGLGPADGQQKMRLLTELHAGLTPIAPEPADACRPVTIDGEPIRVRGGRDMTEADQAALADVIRAVKHRHAAEHPTEDPS